MKIKSVARSIVRSLGYELQRKQEQSAVAVEASVNDLNIIARCQPFTMTSSERLWALLSATSYVSHAGVPGAFVECGVWRGGSTMAVAMKLVELGACKRDLWLYDTFSGMTHPGAQDRQAQSGRKAQELLEASGGRDSKMWCVASLEEARKNVLSTGYPDERLRFVVGDVSKTLATEVPETIALLRLDTDWYESTARELEVLYPKLSHGGVCIIDDYGYWEGARRAVDEYLAREKLVVLMSRIDSTGRMFVKP